MKLLVCGGRHYDDRPFLYHVLDMMHSSEPIELVIEGGASGADSLAALWARPRGIHVATVKALWGKLGRSAGPMRNKAMLLLKPDIVLAFPGGRGTDSMCALATAAGIPVRRAAPTHPQESDDGRG